MSSRFWLSIFISILACGLFDTSCVSSPEFSRKSPTPRISKIPLGDVIAFIKRYRYVEYKYNINKKFFEWYKSHLCKLLSDSSPS